MEETDQEWGAVAEFTDHPQAELARNLLEKHGIGAALWSDDCGGLAVGQTFIRRVRLFVCDADREAALDILGKYGCTSTYPVERMMCDAKVTQIAEGTSQIQCVIIAGALTKGEFLH